MATKRQKKHIRKRNIYKNNIAKKDKGIIRLMQNFQKQMLLNNLKEKFGLIEGVEEKKETLLESKKDTLIHE